MADCDHGRGRVGPFVEGTDAMTPAPKRRWFQSCISTTLILAVIVAWAIALRPWVDYDHSGYAGITNSRGGGILFSWSRPVHRNQLHEDCFRCTIDIVNHSPGRVDNWVVTIGPKQIALPTMAMIAFLGWKGWRRLRQNSSRKDHHGEPKSPESPATQI
jgi:hypothetical protein